MKKCFKCNEVKPLSKFYKHKKMSDGHVNKCKECNKIDVRNNRAKRSDYYREYDAWRLKNQPQVKERHKAYRKTDSGNEAMRESRDRWSLRNPEKRAAHVILGNAIKSGKVKKPTSCSKCMKFMRSRILHGHHFDYTKPLEVEWLCVYCHIDEHKD